MQLADHPGWHQTASAGGRLGPARGRAVATHRHPVPVTVPVTEPRLTEPAVAAIVTVSAKEANNDGSYMQGGLYLGDLTETGLTTVTSMKMFPELNGERAFMRPLYSFAKAQNFAIAIMARPIKKAHFSTRPSEIFSS